MTPRRLLELLLDNDYAGKVISGITDDVLVSIIRRSLADSYRGLMGDEDLSALCSLLDYADTSVMLPAGPDKSAFCRGLYDRLRTGRSTPGPDYHDFESSFKRFVAKLADTFAQLREPRLTDQPCREFGELSLDELSRMQVPEALSGHIIRLAAYFRDRGTLSAADADHVAGLVEKMASAPGYLRFLGEEKKREEIARLAGMAMAVRSAGARNGPEADDMMASIALLLYNLSPSEKVASFLGSVRPSPASKALLYHYNAIMALNHLLTSQLDQASSYATLAMKSATQMGARAYISILQGCIAIRKGDFAGALQLLSKADSRAPAGRLRALASFYRGIIYFERKEYASAMACFESASTHVTDALDQVTVYNNIGMCAMHLGDLPRAERVFSEIEKLSGQLKGDHSLRCKLVASRYGGAIQQARGEYDLAIEHFRQALKLALRSGDGTAIANQLGSLGTAYARAGDGEKGFQLLNACMAYSERVGYRAGIRFAYWHIHRMLLERGNSSEARKFLETYSARYPELKNLL